MVLIGKDMQFFYLPPCRPFFPLLLNPSKLQNPAPYTLLAHFFSGSDLRALGVRNSRCQAHKLRADSIRDPLVSLQSDCAVQQGDVFPVAFIIVIVPWQVQCSQLHQKASFPLLFLEDQSSCFSPFLVFPDPPVEVSCHRFDDASGYFLAVFQYSACQSVDILNSTMPGS